MSGANPWLFSFRPYRGLVPTSSLQRHFMSHKLNAFNEPSASNGPIWTALAGGTCLIGDFSLAAEDVRSPLQGLRISKHPRRSGQEGMEQQKRQR
jgi:hypothetical protein